MLIQLMILWLRVWLTGSIDISQTVQQELVACSSVSLRKRSLWYNLNCKYPYAMGLHSLISVPYVPSLNGMILLQLGCTFFLTRSLEEVGQAGVPGSGQCREDHPLEHAEGRQNGTARSHTTSKYVHGIHTVVFQINTVSFLPNRVHRYMYM